MIIEKKPNAIVWGCTKQFQVHTSLQLFTMIGASGAFPMRISPLYNIKPPDKAKGHPSDFWFGCYVDQFKPQLLWKKNAQLVLVIFQIHGKNSTTNHPYWMNSKSPIWIVWSFWVWFSSLYPQEIQKLHIFSKKIHGFFGLSHAVTKVCRMYTWEFLLGNLLRSLDIHLEKKTRLRM